MKVCVGLGNPGEQYARTRHNVGFRVVDRLQKSLVRPFQPGKRAFFYARGTLEGVPVCLVKPTTYMNLSGQAVRAVVACFDVVPADLLVIVDDVNLPLGRLRLRPGGSAGGHKGLASIIYSLGTDAFPRQRLGIGREEEDRSRVDYVLSPFTRDQETVIEETIGRAVEQIRCWVQGDIEMAMSRYNG